ncbi:MAG: Carboxyl-terminal protease [Parcubacteria group bacterium GW2011_GWA2_47_7]|nr:MAG: Carboxyl-terminal protease [Parcubacteria group bacterium GW2011_GWA2_47_7]
MKNFFRTVFGIIAVSFLMVTTVRAEPTSAEVPYFFKKAWGLTEMACSIYPEIVDSDACVNKVAGKIMSDRGASLERQKEIIRDLNARYQSLYPQEKNAGAQNQEKYRTRKQAYRLMNTIFLTCSFEPEITDFDVCMDKVYHSILSSRDPHSTYFSEKEWAEFKEGMSGKYRGIGAEVDWTIKKEVAITHVMEGSPAERAGVQDGDRIISITNGTVRELTNSFPTMNEAIKKIKGEAGTPVLLEMLRGENDQHVLIAVVRGVITTEMVKKVVLESGDIPKRTFGYIKLNQFGGKMFEKMKSAVQDLSHEVTGSLSGYIFDLRRNGGGNVNEVLPAVDSIIATPDTEIMSVRNNDGIYSEQLYDRQPGDITKGLSCAVLIDRFSASASEIFAAALKKFGRCVIIGERSYGKGSIQSIDPLFDGSFAKQTFGEYVVGSSTDWIAVQCVGVSPDIPYLDTEIKYPEKIKRECDQSAAFASGGASSHPSVVQVPLITRNPTLYKYGLVVIDVIKAMDHAAFVKSEERKKKYNIEDIPAKDESDSEE